jgi:phosphotransferase system enzyme I (PtsP)
MRPASIGPVKSLLRRTDLGELRSILHEERARGTHSLRKAAMDYLRSKL